MKNFLSNYFENEANKPVKNHYPGPVIMISRECGCSAKRIATKLSKILTGYSFHSETKTDVEWKWVSKEIIEAAANELNMDTEKVRNVFLGEAKVSLEEVSTAFSTEKVYDAEDQQVIETVRKVILQLAEKGNYIIVGRAAGVIAQDVSRKLSIKLMAPLEWRINRIMQISNLSHADAQQYVLQIDRQRELFVEHVAGRKLNNNDYDIIFNYSTLQDDHIVDAIVNVIKNKRFFAEEEDN
ncbi:AAA family ATPase [Gaoshiqia sediminis]|uniref:Cytidylate kinase-like family protein n=1 Tax=Gaoshiqia sediminis TaxID=2986998 RepID=A0AA42C4F8_9BACT|nr:cytidylate kinase-like family protein [Gaoshiqia sediminis]MCW0481728.1 cytidylate kinase-like family protein [Gaoshiqia sediminis]